jgi:hypothetical protein
MTVIRRIQHLPGIKKKYLKGAKRQNMEDQTATFEIDFHFS